MTTQERIKADALKAAEGIGDESRRNAYYHGHRDGATAENSRAQVLVDALEKAYRLKNLWLYTGDVAPEHEGEAQALSEMASQIETALEQWKGGKVEPPKPVASNCGMCGKLGNNQYLGNQFYLCDECFEDYEKGRDQPTPY